MNDLISRQAAIDALIKWYGCEPTDIGAFEDIIEELSSAQPEPSQVARDIANIIENEKDMRVIATHRWIPCSERLPELDVPIVFTTAIGTLDVGFRIDANTLNQFYSETGKRRRNNDDVIAWQPLPEPYHADMRGEE